MTDKIDSELSIVFVRWEQEGAKFGFPLSDAINDVKKLCIEQACEAVDAKKKKTIPGRVSISMFDDAYNDGLDAAEQAIRDRFNAASD